eukprot:CAMPEP_0184319406 /NCGR_PEP_ID=MMETSP1049-20130417/108318_1 /TAXON_ID=77928 /ORGANISM="Proteomonas sulcata, Strain CCMP704" /LENGTH=114 /DNA_ID=CAMNT_0026639535 /DNA_START=141 /DNA_END=482 /DNA_ORIENTATION=+
MILNEGVISPVRGVGTTNPLGTQPDGHASPVRSPVVTSPIRSPVAGARANLSEVGARGPNLEAGARFMPEPGMPIQEWSSIAPIHNLHLNLDRNGSGSSDSGRQVGLIQYLQAT